MADEADDVTGLNDVFETASEPEPDTQDVEPQGEADAKSEPEPAAKGESNAGTPPADKDGAATTSEPDWSKQAYFDEKRKRQELERRLAELEKPEKQEKEEVDLFVDPKGFTDGIKNEIKQAVLSEKISLSRELMLETKTDYTEKEARFVEMVKADPSLLAKMNASANPAKFAYETAAKAFEFEAKQKLLDEIGDPVAYREKLKAELLAELQGKPAPRSREKVETTPSLATLSGTKPAADVPYVNPLDEVMEGSPL